MFINPDTSYEEFKTKEIPIIYEKNKEQKIEKEKKKEREKRYREERA